MAEQVVFPGNVGKTVMMFFDAAAEYGKGEGFWLRMGLRQVETGLALGLLGFAPKSIRLCGIHDLRGPNRERPHRHMRT
jgi:hypothetical protein